MPNNGRNKIGEAAKDSEDEHIYGIKDESQRNRNKIPKLRVDEFAHYREKLSEGEWIYPPKDAKNKMIEEYYPIDSQWICGYAFDITSGESPDRVEKEVKYWQRILPQTDRGKGDRPLMGFAKPSDEEGKKQKHRYFRGSVRSKPEHCTECSRNTVFDYGSLDKFCTECGVCFPVYVLDMSPEAVVEARGIAGDGDESLADAVKKLGKEIRGPKPSNVAKEIHAQESGVGERMRRIHGILSDIHTKTDLKLEGEQLESVKRIIEGVSAVIFSENEWQEDGKKETIRAWDLEKDRGSHPIDYTSEGRGRNQSRLMTPKEKARYAQLRDIVTTTEGEAPEQRPFVVNAGHRMTSDMATKMLRGEIEYCESRFEKEDDVKKKWEQIRERDPISDVFIEWAKRRLSEVGSVYSFEEYRWDFELEFCAGILVCAMTSDVNEDEVVIDNQTLMKIHKAMLAEPVVTYTDESVNRRKTEKGLAKKKKPDMRWEYMSIVAVVIFVRRYYWFFEEKMVIWK